MKNFERLLVLVPPRGAGAGGRPHPNGQTPLRYAALAAGRREEGVTPAALLPKADRVELYFDAGDVLVTRLAAPKLAAGKLRLALPNLLEERLLGATADAHFAYMPTGAGEIAVAVIDRTLLTRTLQVLDEAKLRPRLAASALYLLPRPAAEQVEVQVGDGRGVARWGEHDGMAFDFDGATAPAALQLALRQSGARQVRVGGKQAAEWVAALAPLGVEVQPVAAADPPAAGDALDLLQGEFAPAGWWAGFASGRGAVSGKAVLGWAGAAAVLFLLGLNVHWLKLESESRALREQALAAFRGAFPSYTSTPEDVAVLAREARRELDSLRARAGLAAPGDFTVLDNQAAQLLAAAPVGAVAGVEYRDGVLRVKFKPGQQPDAALQNRLRSLAVQLALDLRWDSDGSLRLAPAE
jgi:general secretion pathway protein L